MTYDLISDPRLTAALRKLASRPTAVTLADVSRADQPLVYVNPAFERLTGYTFADVVGTNCRFLQGAETDPGAVARIRDAVTRRVEGAYCLLNYRKTGAPFHNLLMMTPLDTVSGGRYILGCQYEIRSHMLSREVPDHVASVQGVVGDLAGQGGMLDQMFWKSFHMRTDAIRLAVDGYLLSVAHGAAPTSRPPRPLS